MAQHDQVIDNGPGLVVRQDINVAIAALFSTSSGPVEPQVCVAGQLWLDTSVQPQGQLKQRNLTNSGWTAPNITLGAADLWFGTRLTPDRFIWNDQANTLGNDIMTLSQTGWLGLGMPGGTAGLNASIGLSAKVDQTSGDYFVINTKADGSGTDRIKFRNSGVGEFGGAVFATGSYYVKAASGNVHLWFQGPAGEDRGLIYTPVTPQGHMYLRVGGTQTFTFGSNGSFYSPVNVYAGNAYLPTDGNVAGNVWDNWGAHDSYSAISARIESRAQAWANSVAASGITSTRMAGYVEYEHTSGSIGTTASYGAYVMVMSRRVNADNYAFGFRQPQVYYPASGWVAAFPF